MRALLSVLIVCCAVLPMAHLVADEKPSAADKVPPTSARILRQYLRGTPQQKTQALDIIRDLKAVELIPEVIVAISDPTASPRDGDTGWGFVGHQAATVMGELAHAIDRVTVDKRGRHDYSFFDDQSEGGAKLKEIGRLAEVQERWKKWWDTHTSK